MTSEQRTAPIARSFCEVCTWHDLHILVTAPFCCDRKSRAVSAQSFTLWQQATIEITRRDHSIIACSRHIYMGVILRAHPACGESHIQRNANREVTTVLVDFSKSFSWGAKVVKFGSYYSKLKKQPFSLKFSNSFPPF